MASNQDRVDAVLDQMQKDNDPQTLSDGLNILCKLTSNIKSNPFDHKYRSIKTSNNTIKNKIMVLKHVEELLKILGFMRETEEIFMLRDQHIGEFIEGETAIDFRRRLVAAKLNNEADYQKELSLIKIHKQNRLEQQKRDEQSRRLKEQCKYDQQERAHMKADETKSNNLKFGIQELTSANPKEDEDDQEDQRDGLFLRIMKQSLQTEREVTAERRTGSLDDFIKYYRQLQNIISHL